jgi:hypothetical protein
MEIPDNASHFRDDGASGLSTHFRDDRATAKVFATFISA